MISFETKHYESLDGAIRSLYGNNITIVKKAYVGGGDINESYRLLLSDGTVIFMKENSAKSRSFFDAEAAGLYAIEKTETIRVPKVLATGTDRNRAASFLLLEYIERGSNTIQYWKQLARGLAALHSADASSFLENGKYGFFQDNYIGETDQINTVQDSWVTFFRDCRLAPQIKKATHYFSREDLKSAEKLLEYLDKILTEPDHPSLIHGDLWGGNVMPGANGEAYLIDPAAYVGSSEADIAMTELFGRFPAVFYSTYEELIPLKEGYNVRRDVYNLYHLLNHLNLFGSGYLSSVRRILAGLLRNFPAN